MRLPGGELLTSLLRRVRGGAAAHLGSGQSRLGGGAADQRRVLVALLRRGRIFEAEGESGDVVAAAGAVGFVDQGPHGGAHRAGAGEQLGDLLLVQHRRQSVGADQEDIARGGGHGLQIGFDLGLRTECPGDDRALRVVLRLGVRDLALAPHLLDQRVVTGQLLELAGPQPVGTAVADVADRHLFGLEIDDRGRGRRPHPGQAGVFAGQLVDRAVGALDRLLQDLLRRTRRQPKTGGTHGRQGTQDRRPRRIRLSGLRFMSVATAILARTPPSGAQEEMAWTSGAR